MFAGVDLGYRGAVAKVGSTGRLLYAELCAVHGPPSKPTDYDVSEMARQASVIRGCVLVAIEAPAPVNVPRFGRNGRPAGMMVEPRGTMSLAECAGIWRALLEPHTKVVFVPSNTWQTTMLKGYPGNTKAQSIARARICWPEIDLRPLRFRTDQDGLADAANLADYARNLHRST